MKKIVFFIMILFATGFCTPKKKITKILVNKVDMEISTLVRIDCNSFESTFRNDPDLKTYTIKNKSVLYKMDSFLEKIKPADETNNVDTRKIIIIFYSDTTKDTICADLFRIKLNGNLMVTDRSTLDFILNL